MRPDSRLRPIGWIIAALLLAGLVAALVGALVERQALAQFGAQVTADARLRQALLASEIARFRLLPLTLADDSDIIAALRGAPGAAARVDRKLEALAARTGAAVIYVIAPDGRALAASNWRLPTSFVGQDYSFRRYARDAFATGAGEQFAMGSVSRRPGLFLSRRTRDGGVVVVKLEFDAIERQWRAAGGTTFVTDRAGVVLVSSRPAWRFAATRPIAPAKAAAARAHAGVTAFGAAPIHPARGGRVRIDGAAGPMLLAATPPDSAGWQVQLARPTGAVDTNIRTAQIAAALAMLALLGLIWARRTRAGRRRARIAALEAAVAARTADLSREIDERISAEARAADLRDGLRQANRLAVLGQVTASVAHETAQPVAAIRNYAANSEILLDRGDTEAVRDNLRIIARLTDRIGTVTAQLRGFARKGSGSIGPISLAAAIDGAVLILKERLSRVTLTVPPIPADLHVIAGRIRLEQVLVNLLQNATEALEATTDPQVLLTLTIDGDRARLTVADNGSGVTPEIAERIFTPFATSRAAGLGLGLVIAQDIMVDFGGVLRLVPSDAGACFEIVLRIAP